MRQNILGIMRNVINFIFSNKNLSDKGLSMVILMFRLFGGGMMLPFGIKKIQNFQEYSINFFDDPIGIGMVPSLVLTIFAQVGCSLALMSGFFSRPVALILAFNMMVACKYHWHDEFATLSLPMLFFGIYCVLSLSGGGRYSVDACIFSCKKK